MSANKRQDFESYESTNAMTGRSWEHATRVKFLKKCDVFCPLVGRSSDLLGDGDEGGGQAEHHDEEARGGHGEVEQQQQGGGLLAVHLHTNHLFNELASADAVRCCVYCIYIFNASAQ